MSHAAPRCARTSKRCASPHLAAALAQHLTVQFPGRLFFKPSCRIFHGSSSKAAEAFGTCTSRQHSSPAQLLVPPTGIFLLLRLLSHPHFQIPYGDTQRRPCPCTSSAHRPPVLIVCCLRPALAEWPAHPALPHFYLRPLSVLFRPCKAAEAFDTCTARQHSSPAQLFAAPRPAHRHLPAASCTFPSTFSIPIRTVVRSAAPAPAHPPPVCAFLEGAVLTQDRSAPLLVHIDLYVRHHTLYSHELAIWTSLCPTSFWVCEHQSAHPALVFCCVLCCMSRILHCFSSFHQPVCNMIHSSARVHGPILMYGFVDGRIGGQEGSWRWTWWKTGRLSCFSHWRA